MYTQFSSIQAYNTYFIFMDVLYVYYMDLNVVNKERGGYKCKQGKEKKKRVIIYWRNQWHQWDCPQGKEEEKKSKKLKLSVLFCIHFMVYFLPSF